MSQTSHSESNMRIFRNSRKSPAGLVKKIFHRRGSSMATLTIRNVAPVLVGRLRARATRNGRSMEAELRDILTVALGLSGVEEKSRANLAEAIRLRFLPFAGLDKLTPHPPVEVGHPPALDL
jgi:antitoxin FitA